MNQQIGLMFESIHKQLNKVKNQSSFQRTENRLKKQPSQIRLHELQLFKTYFEMRLFDMATVNLKFILAAGLFALQLIVFLIQTN